MSDTILNILVDRDWHGLSRAKEALEVLKAKSVEENDWDQFDAFQKVLGFVDEVKQGLLEADLVPEQYLEPEPGMEIACWPDVQNLMEHPDFEEEAILINDEYGLNQYQSSAYFVPQHIIEHQQVEHPNS